MGKAKLFYGWIVTALLFFVSAVPMVFTFAYWTFYQIPVCTEFDINYSTFALAATGATLTGMVFGVFFADKYSRGNSRHWLLVCGVANAVCWTLMGIAPSVWMIIVLRWISGFFCVGAFTLGFNVFIPRWFVHRRGLALTLCVSGKGVGGLFLISVMSGNIANLGWRPAIMIAGAVSIVAFIFVWLFMRNYPADMGLSPLMPPDKDTLKTAENKAKKAPSWGLTKKEALKTPVFWVFAASLALSSIIFIGPFTQMAPYFTEIGLDYAVVMSFYSGVVIVATPLMGWIYDKIGLKGAVVTNGVVTVATIAAMMLAPNAAWIAFAAGAGIAFANAGPSALPGLVTAKIFGDKDHGAIFGMSNTAFMVGTMCGTMLVPGLRDALGEWNTAWMLLIALSVVATVLMLVAMKMGERLKAGYVAQPSGDEELVEQAG